MRSIGSIGVRVISSTLVPRLSLGLAELMGRDPKEEAFQLLTGG